MAMFVLQTPLTRGGTTYTGSMPTAADQRSSSFHYREQSGITRRGSATSQDRTYSDVAIIGSSSGRPTESHYLFLRFTELDTDTYARDLYANAINPDTDFLMHYRVGSRTFGLEMNRFIRVLNDTWVYNQRLPAGAYLSFRFIATFRRVVPAVSRFRLLPNRRPVVASRSVATNSAAITINLNDVYRNENANTQFAVNTSSSGICQAAISGRTLTLTPGSAVGTATITLIGWGAGQVEEYGSFTVRTFRPATTNPAPTRVGTIPNASAQVSTAAQRVNVSSYFRDTDTLTYSAASSNTNVVTTSVSGSTVTLTPGSTVGTSTITVTATDTASQTINQTFTFTTSAAPPVNPVPARVGTIPNRTAVTGSTAHTLNVASYFTDTDTLTYSAVSSITGVVSVSVSGSVVTMTPGSTAGLSTITVTATDTANQSITQAFTFRTHRPAAPPNPVPTASGTIPNITAQVGSAAHTVTASTYFRDTDTLTYSVASSNTSVATVSVSGSTVTVTPGTTTGSSTITITATDTDAQTATQTFTITTTSAPAPNPAPTRVGTISNRSAQVSTSASTLNIASYFRDTDTLTYGVASSNTNVVAVSVSGSTITMMPGSAAGSSTVTVTATDTASQAVTQTFTFTTTSAPVVNPAPTRVGTIPNRNFQVSASAQTLTMSSYFSDTDALTYSAVSSNTPVVTVSVSGTVLTMTPGATVGASTITVTATDTANQSISQTFTFITTARPVTNPPPQQVGTISSQTWQAGTGPHSIAAASYFLDTDAITYAISTSHGTIATATINETTGTAAITAVAAGTATISITATDTANQTATQAFLVTVTSAEAPEAERPNSPPVVSAVIPTQRLLVGGEVRVPLSSYFSDPGDILLYSVVSKDLSALLPTLHSGDILSLHSLEVGNVDVVVTATDSLGQQISQTFTVMILASTEATQSENLPQTLLRYIRIDDPPMVFENISSWFNGAGTITAQSSHPGVATAVVANDTLTITPKGSGYFLITLTFTPPGE